MAELPPLYERMTEVAAAARELVAVCRADDVELPYCVVPSLLGLGDALKALDAERDALYARLGWSQGA